jgi:hypothetical protein
MKVLYDEYEEESTRTAGVLVRVILSSVDDLWGLLGTPDEGMKEEGGKSGIVEWISVPWSLVRMELLELCEVVPLRRRRHRRLLQSICCLRPSFGGWELAEVISFAQSSLSGHFTNATVLKNRSHGVRCCQALFVNDVPSENRLVVFRGHVSLL